MWTTLNNTLSTQNYASPFKISEPHLGICCIVTVLRVLRVGSSLEDALVRGGIRRLCILFWTEVKVVDVTYPFSMPIYGQMGLAFSCIYLYVAMHRVVLMPYFKGPYPAAGSGGCGKRLTFSSVGISSCNGPKNGARDLPCQDLRRGAPASGESNMHGATV